MVQDKNPKAHKTSEDPQTKQEIEAEIARLEAQLAVLNSVPPDTFHFGTVMVFSIANPAAHWYYAKTGEELWLNVQTGQEQPLANWILEAEESNVGYFEVYEMRAQPTPFYASP